MTTVYSRQPTKNKFQDGTESEWELNNLVIPENFIVFSTDSHIIKKGDGIRTFSELDVWIDLDNMPTGETGGTPVILGPIPPAGSVGKIVIVGPDGKYKQSALTINEILLTLNSTNSADVTQDENISILNNLCLLLEILQTSDRDKIMIISGGQYRPSAYTLADINNTIKSNSSIMLGLSIAGIDFYNELGLINKITTLSENTTYYAKISAKDENHLALTYDLTCANADVTISVTGIPNVYQIIIGNLTEEVEVTFVATVSNNTISKVFNKDIMILSFRLICGIYNGVDEDVFNDVALDADGNIIAVGSTYSEGAGGMSALIVKFDKDLNVISKKIYGGNLNDSFQSVKVDHSNNYIVVGHSESITLGSKSGLIVKFDNDLNSAYPVITHKLYGAANSNVEFHGVAIDSNNNFFAVGTIFSDGIGEDGALIVKFNSNLSIGATKIYTEAGKSNCFISVAIDVNNRPVAVGNHIDLVDPNSDYGIIAKFTNTLESVLAAKSFKGDEGSIHFHSVKVDNNNNYVIVGETEVDSLGGFDGLFIRVNSNVELLNKKSYGGIGTDSFSDLVIDEYNNYYIVGYSTIDDEVDSPKKGIIFKLNNALARVAEKSIGETGNNKFLGICFDDKKNLVAVGASGVALSNLGAFISRINPNLSPGNYSGLIVPLMFEDLELDYQDCSESYLLAPWVLIFSSSGATLSISGLSLQVSDLSYTSDIIS